ncbi:MAG: TldD/PmbA family protein [bacterium]|nr:TldD/PmbA family protein [bacterium]
MEDKELLQYCLNALKKAGVPKAQCRLTHDEKHEFNVANNSLSLLRTTHDSRLRLSGIVDRKKGSLTLNSLATDSIDRAIEELVTLANSSQADPAYDIAPPHEPMEFSSGPESPDLERMHQSLTDFLGYCQASYPTTILGEINFDFTRTHHYLQNSHDVDFVEHQGQYNCFAMFTSKEGRKSSSFNYALFSSRELEKELQEFASLDSLLKQSSEQIEPRSFPQKIEGELLISPHCLGDFIQDITGFLGNYSLISGNSIFKNKLHKNIAVEKLTLHSQPCSDEPADGYSFTSDGFPAKNSTIIQHGVLNSFLLDLYGSRKTGHPRAVNEGGAYVVDAGGTPLETMIASVRKGVLLGRFSGGTPSENGDFSGVAKNSYYIENGEIQYPIRETMISGNLAALLNTIRFISQERVNFGYAIYPWILAGGVVIS